MIEPVGAVVDGLEQLPSGGRREVHVALQQAAHRRLDRRERRAQIVRHRGEQRGPQFVRLFEVSRAGRVGAERALLHGDRHLPGERLEHVEVVGPEVGAADHQDVVARQRHREIGRVGPVRHRSARRRRPRPSRNQTSGDSTPTDSASNAACTCATSCGSGSAAATSVPLSDAKVSASARACAASTVRRDAVETSTLTTPPTSRKITKREEVLALGDGELVEGWGEEPVGEQEARDRADEGRDETTERGDDHDEQEQDEEIARQRECVAELGEDERHQWRAGERERPRERAPARRHREDPSPMSLPSPDRQVLTLPLRRLPRSRGRRCHPTPGSRW